MSLIFLAGLSSPVFAQFQKYRSETGHDTDQSPTEVSNPPQANLIPPTGAESDPSATENTPPTGGKGSMPVLKVPGSSRVKVEKSAAGGDSFKKIMDKKTSEENINEVSPDVADNAEESPAGADMEDPSEIGGGTGIHKVKGNYGKNKYVNLNPETAFGPEVITSFDFPDVSLVDLTKHMQSLSGMNLILDKDLKGQVSISAPSPITVGDAWKAYLTALNINGYTLIKNGAFYRIVPARDIRYTPTKIYTGTFTPDTENYVMKILPLKNIDSTEVTRSFRPFMSRYGRIIEIKQTNTIIIQDTGANVNRLNRLIQFLDVPGHEETLQIIKVSYSSAQEIAKLLDQILKGTGGQRFSPGGLPRANQNISRIIAEPRTNSIIALANA
ncbi:MAG: secretin N-terminal domain-containing protein, partial [Pseudomonadota bacterium]